MSISDGVTSQFDVMTSRDVAMWAFPSKNTDKQGMTGKGHINAGAFSFCYDFIVTLRLEVTKGC